MPIRCECDLIGCDGTACMRERVEIAGHFFGWVEAYRKPRRQRLGGGRVDRPSYFCFLPNGKRTEFTLPSRRQAVEWLMQAGG